MKYLFTPQNETFALTFGLLMPVKDRPTILVTTVDIGGGRNGVIEIKKGDDPEVLAARFCDMHGLPDTVVGPLTDHLLDNLRKAAATKGVMSPPSLKPSESPFLKSNPSHATQDKQFFDALEAKMMPYGQGEVLTVSRDYLSGDGADKVLKGSKAVNRLYNGGVDQKKRTEAKLEEMRKDRDSMDARPDGKIRMSWISAEMMRERTHGPFDNYGEMLYAEALESTAIKKSKLALMKAEKEAQELSGATFSPIITPLARSLGNHRSSAFYGVAESGPQPPWQRLSQANKNARTMERLDDLRKLKETQELQGCTFKPQIDAKSKAMMSKRADLLASVKMTPHEQLFQDAIRRQHKKEELANWLPDEVTFAPAVNKTLMAQEFLRRCFDDIEVPSDAHDSTSGAPSVVERLYAMHEKSKMKLEAAREKYHGNVDPVSGRELYRPAVGRGPKNMARPATASSVSDASQVHEQLYALAMERLHKLESAAEAERRQMEEDSKKAKASGTSDKLFQRLKNKRFIQVFEYLDVGKDGSIDLVGMIRSPTERLQDLDPEVREDVEMAAELYAKSLNIIIFPSDSSDQDSLTPAPPVSEDEFVELLGQALISRRGPRGYLVPSPSVKPSKFIEQPTFKPEICPKSRQMASRLRPNDAPVYEQLYQTSSKIKAKIEEKKREQEDQEILGCTFTPALNLNSLQSEGRALKDATSTNFMSRLAQVSEDEELRVQGEGARKMTAQLSSDASLIEFADLEREVREALAGASLASKTLDSATLDLQATEDALRSLLDGGRKERRDTQGSQASVTLESLARELLDDN